MSVGIGFGLQNLVNNFVSGVILLAERPIRVGDLVVVGGERGYVRKISVRSTELETLDRANVLIPNSYFISEKVKNWTFRNNVSRISITVGVAYGSDARQVQAALLAVAQKHPEVLTAPAPSVTLDDFAASNITFTLYAFIGDITKSGAIRTDLAMGILDAFAEAGIAIPAGRNEITIRNLDSLREMIAQNASAPPGKSPSNGGSKSPSEAVPRMPLRSRAEVVGSCRFRLKKCVSVCTLSIFRSSLARLRRVTSIKRRPKRSTLAHYPAHTVIISFT